MPIKSTTLSTTKGDEKHDPTNSHDNSDSEESALIVWEDETSKVDFRHFLLNEGNANGKEGGSVNMDGGDCSDNDDDDGNAGDGAAQDGNNLRLRGTTTRLDRRSSSRRRLPLPVAMTQQIEDLSSGSSSSDDDDDDEDEDNNNEGRNDKKIQHGRIMGHNVGEEDGLKSNETMTPPPNPHRFSKQSNQILSPESSGDSATKHEHGEHRDTIAAITTKPSATAPGSKLKRRKNKRHLMNDEGDIPATISKLRRQNNHGTRRSSQEPKMTISHTYQPHPASPTTLLTTTIITVPQQVVEKENQPPPQRAIIEVQTDEKTHSANYTSCDNGPQSEPQCQQSAKSKLEVCQQDNDRTGCDGLLTNDVESLVPSIRTNSGEHLPPPPVTKTADFCDSFPDIPQANYPQQQQQQQHDLSVSSQYDHANLHHELQHLQQPPSLTKSATHCTKNCDDNGCRDLFREIELGLDQVCGAPDNAYTIAHGIVDSIINPSSSTALSTAIASSSTSSTSPTANDKVVKGVDEVYPGIIDDNDEYEEWNDDDLAAIDLSVAMVANLNQPSHIQASGVRPSSSSTSSSLLLHPHQQQMLSSPKQSSVSSSISASNCYHAMNPPNHSASSSLPHSSATAASQQRSPTLTPVQLPGSAPELKGHCDVMRNHEFNNDDVCGLDDDESWNDDDLAAIDLSVALTRSSLNSSNRSGEAESAPTATNHPSSPNNFHKNGVIISDDDDRYFAEMDFNALDDTIARHNQLRYQQQQQQQQNVFSQQQVGTQSVQLPTLQFHPPPPPPPPPLAPIFNRKRQLPLGSSHDLENQSSMPVSHLSFTRYTVQIVQEDLLTYTKTIGVSLWNNSQDDNKKNAGDELDDLISICKDQSKNNFPQKPACGDVIDGYLHLRGEWYHTSCQPGDIIQLCSLSGVYLTDTSALPVVLHSHPPPSSDPNDDLLLVLHPDELISPTIVSEAVQCPRLAVLRSRLGSTGMSSRSAVIGILRHELFERCLREKDASHKSAAIFTRQIIRRNADALLGCGVIDQREAFGEVIKTLSQIQLFLRSFTSWNATKHPKFSVINGGIRGDTKCSYTPTTLLKGMFASCDTLIEIRDVYSTEQWMHVPELGLKGNVDATVVARVKPLSSSNISSHSGMQDLLLPVELKTGHVQNPNHNHLAQLSIYTMMLRARQGSCTSFVQSLTQNNAGSMSDDPEMGFDAEALGAASSGMLLYLNHEDNCTRHVKPTLNDVKTLMGQRNKLASNVIRASRPRGIALVYEADELKSNNTGFGQKHSRSRVVVKEGIAPPSALPELHPNINSCERCYKNRECMMYASADMNSNNASSHTPTLFGNSGHKLLLDHFTGHLQGADLEYFCKWDMLIDLERHASSKNVLSSWLYESENKESKDGKCISSLVLAQFVTDDIDSGGEEDTLIRFVRSEDATHTTALSSLNFEVGSHAIISEDGTSFASKSKKEQKMVAGRQEIHILRGTVVRIGDKDIDIAVPSKDIHRFKRLVKWGDDSRTKNFTASRNIDTNCSIVRKKFRLDKDEYVGLFGLLLQNLVNFFTLDIPPFSAESYGSPLKTKSLTAGTEISGRRRRLNSCIVQLEPCPRFLKMSVDSVFACGVSGVDLPGCDYISLRRDFDRLNSDQKEAVLKVVSAEDFALIQGLPGTGKSETISFITRLLVMRGKRVLLTSYTHSAVDNLLCKLMESGVTQPFKSQKNPRNPIIRIGQLSSCHLQIRPILAHAVARETERFDCGATTSMEQPSVEYLHKVISEAKVVGVSALTVPRSPLLAGQHFDVVIVDEAGQISQPAVLGAIMAADSFVLVGDHMQLPPLVISEVAEEGGFGISMLKRLADAFPDAIAKLTIQYRMNESICQLPNIVAYHGLLRCGSDQVRQQKLDLCMSMISQNENPVEMPWIKRAINPDYPVVFLDTDGKGWLESDGGAGGQINTTEVSIVQSIVHSLSLCGLDQSSIGVITPFRSQLRALEDNNTLKEFKSKGLEICTIDRFQGRDKPAIILSLVRSNSEGKTGRLLQDYRRLNVAFSRAKKKIIIVGSFSTLCKGSHVLCPVLEYLHERNWVYKMV